MALNIKNEEVYRLARKLADQLGVSMTEAVRVALEFQLARTEDREQKVKDLLEIGQRCATKSAGGPSVQEIEKDMYDEFGMPQ